MFFKFLPRESNFFELFDKQAGFAVEAAVYFKGLASKGALDEPSLKHLHEIEHKGDEVTHSIIDQLNKTFITPFDREDIHALAKEIDDIIDMIYTIASRMKIYKTTKVNKNLVEFASLIEESTRGVSCAVKGLSNIKNCKAIADSCVEINRLENEGDTLRDKMLEELFESEKDLIELIKWKEIYQDAETVLDICEDVANIVESIVVKQA